jgi:hypothetical protein
MAKRHIEEKLLLSSGRHRFLQAEQASTGDEDDDAADLARAEGDAEAISKAEATTNRAPLPEPLFGIETTAMSCDVAFQLANVSFQMPFEAQEDFMMDIDWERKDYRIMLNWGVFSDENDTDKTNIFGAKYMEDQISWRFFEPKGALRTAFACTTMLLAAAAALIF